MSTMASNVTDEEYTSDNGSFFTIAWLSGIAVSMLCFSLQALMLIIIPKIRKSDQKILIQLTLARLIYSTSEYMVNYFPPMSYGYVFLLFTVYQQIDLVLICWMLMFTKNLYNKITEPLKEKKFYYLAYTLLIWVTTFLIGMLCPVLIATGYTYYKWFYNVWACIKLCVICYIVWLLFHIYSVAINCMGFGGCDKRARNLIKTCVVAFIIVTISFLQVLITDFLSYFNGANEIINISFSIINSYQVLAITIIFTILVKNSLNQ